VPHRFKVILFSKFILKFLNVLIHHLYESTALKADKVVMMFSHVHLFVSGLTFTDLYLFSQTCFKKEIDISMDSGISNRGVLFLYPVKKFINSYVATCGEKGIQNLLSLFCIPEAQPFDIFPEDSLCFFLAQIFTPLN